MRIATQTPQQNPSALVAGSESDDTVDTLLWIEEHDWLYSLLRSGLNVSPKFRMTDLISACVSQLFAKDCASDELFRYLGSELILREPGTVRRREAMWRPQYQQLHALQLSAANRYPNPQFHLDQITTACVSLARTDDTTGACTLRHARINIARRSAIARVMLSA